MHVHDRGARQARIEIAAGRRHRRVPSPRLQPGRHAGRRMPPPGLHAHAADADALACFSCLADSGASSTRRFASGADARDRRSRRFGRARRARTRRAPAPPHFSTAAVAQPTRPRLLVRVNGIATGLIDADLDAVMPAPPDGILLPKAEGGTDVSMLAAKLAVREADPRPARRPHQDPRAWRPRPPPAIFGSAPSAARASG